MRKVKKILVTTLSMLAITSATLGMASCGLLGGVTTPTNSSTQETTKNEIREIYDLYVVSAKAQGETPLTYEQWLLSIRGEKGDQGEQGPQGEQGEAGVSIVDVKITYSTNADGEAVMVFTFYMSNGSTIVEEVAMGQMGTPEDPEEPAPPRQAKVWRIC